MLPSLHGARDDTGMERSGGFDRKLPPKNSGGCAGGGCGFARSAGTAGHVPQPPHSARITREERQEQLLPHEDTVRAVYKKHAQAFFEDIKEGFLREATTLRKHAQKALASVASHAAWEVDGLDASSHAGGADQKGKHPAVTLAARLDKQQEDLKNLTRHVQTEFAFAKKATLTPMWKERTLQEIAQGELRVVCAEEVGRAFKDLAASFDERQVEAAILRLCAAGPMPWETKMQNEVRELGEHCDKQFRELSLRADESTAARAVLVDCCNAMEQRQRAEAERLGSLCKEVQGLRSDQLSSIAAQMEGFRSHLNSVDERVRQLSSQVDESVGQLTSQVDDRFGQLTSQGAAMRADLSREAEERSDGVAHIKTITADLAERIQACEGKAADAAQVAAASAKDTAEAAALAQEARRVADEVATQAHSALADASAAGTTAARSRAEAEAARGLAAGAVETVAKSEAVAAQHAVRFGSLEGRVEELQRQAQAASDLAKVQTQKLADTVSQLQVQLVAAEAHFAERPAERPLALEAFEPRAAEGAVVSADPSQASEGLGQTHDPMYVAAKLRAHLEFIEARIKEVHRHAEGLGDQISSHGRKLAESSGQATVRLEALEGRFDELHRHSSGLSSDISSHARRLTDASTQQAARIEAVEDRIRGLHLNIESLSNDLSLRMRSAADSTAQNATAVSALEERLRDWSLQVRQCGDQISCFSSSTEDLRRDFGTLSTRADSFETKQQRLQHDYGMLDLKVEAVEPRLQYVFNNLHNDVEALRVRVNSLETTQMALPASLLDKVQHGLATHLGPTGPASEPQSPPRLPLQKPSKVDPTLDLDGIKQRAADLLWEVAASDGASPSKRADSEVQPIGSEIEGAQLASSQNSCQDVPLEDLKKRAADMLIKASDDGSLDNAIKSLSEEYIAPQTANSASPESTRSLMKEGGQQQRQQQQHDDATRHQQDPAEQAQTGFQLQEQGQHETGEQVDEGQQLRPQPQLQPKPQSEEQPRPQQQQQQQQRQQQQQQQQQQQRRQDGDTGIGKPVDDSFIVAPLTQRASTAGSAPRASTAGSAPSRVRPGSGISTSTDLKNESELPDHQDRQQELAELASDPGLRSVMSLSRLSMSDSETHAGDIVSRLISTPDGQEGDQ